MASTEVSVNVHDHGKDIDEQKKTAQSNYCGKVVTGFTRLKCHLAGVRENVSPCGEVPANVKELMKEKMLEFKRGNIRKEVNKLNHPDLPSKMKSSLKSNNVSAATPTSLHRMINGIHSYHQVEYEFPRAESYWGVQGRKYCAHCLPFCVRMYGSLMDKCQTLFSTVCASHCIEMILEKIGMMGTTGDVLDKAKTIARFIYSHAMVLNLMRNHNLVHDLVKPSKRKPAIPFLTLQNIVPEKGRLENMLISSVWKNSHWASRRQGKWVADIVVDPSFWSGAEMALKPTVPLVGVLLYGYNLNIIRMWMVILGWGEPQRRNGFHPALLWSDCGVHCPELQKLATQILSQTCYGALRYKPKRGLDENLLTKGRNSAEQERLYDPMFVHYNLHLWDSDWSTDSDIGFEETNQ
ncbi:hypothetical protein AAG906_030731 [Vitis piasezkii]